MPKYQFDFILQKEAQGTGGDRYETILPDVDKPYVVYIHQSISRADGRRPPKVMQISFGDVE